MNFTTDEAEADSNHANQPTVDCHSKTGLPCRFTFALLSRSPSPVSHLVVDEPQTSLPHLSNEPKKRGCKPNTKLSPKPKRQKIMHSSRVSSASDKEVDSEKDDSESNLVSNPQHDKNALS